MVTKWLRLLAILAMTFFVGCEDEQDKESAAQPTASESAEDASALAARLGCSDVVPFDGLVGPIRAGAAASGVRCVLDGSSVDVFERAPFGDGRPNQPYAVADGGSVENIERLTGAASTAVPDACIAFLLIGERWFVVAQDQAAVDTAKGRLGGKVRDVKPLTTPVSYQLPGCQG